MSFDAHTYHVEKTSVPNYLRSPSVMNTTMWQHTESGLELAKEEDQMPVTGIVVGQVSPYHLKCGPAGNHMNSNVSPLAKVKYQFYLSHPADHKLGMDFDASVTTLNTLQKQVRKSGQCKCYKNIHCWHGPYSFSSSLSVSTYTPRTTCAYTCNTSSG
jgi:hypothetical protein